MDRASTAHRLHRRVVHYGRGAHHALAGAGGRGRLRTGLAGLRRSAEQSLQPERDRDSSGRRLPRRRFLGLLSLYACAATVPVSVLSTARGQQSPAGGSGRADRRRRPVRPGGSAVFHAARLPQQGLLDSLWRDRPHDRDRERPGTYFGLGRLRQLRPGPTASRPAGLV